MAFLIASGHDGNVSFQGSTCRTKLAFFLVSIAFYACAKTSSPLEKPSGSSSEGDDDHEKVVPADAASITVVDANETDATHDSGVAQLGAESDSKTRSLPDGVNELPLEGFNPAVFVAPQRTDEPPWPLIVILHGNYDRPEWQCETWAKVGRTKGWVLCLRGYPRTEADPELDRWTYQGRAKLALEIERGVSTLEALFPSLLRRDGATLIGFSLGANMAPRLVGMGVLPFTSLVLAEGGYQVTPKIARVAARKGIKRVVNICGERTACPLRAKGLKSVWRGVGISSKTVVMRGVGHGYCSNFDPIARRVFNLMGEDESD